jgi:transforming growth factor-beta-induced protein
MKTMLRTARLWLLAPLVLAMAACDDSDPVAPETPQTVVDIALEANRTSGEFSTLIAALTAADLVGTLQGAGPFTVFAPTDAAFAAMNLNAGNVGTVPAATLQGILLYHVAPGRLAASEVTARTSIQMANGGTAGISVAQGVARIDGARIVQTDLEAGNGVVHVIDAVLTP